MERDEEEAGAAPPRRRKGSPFGARRREAPPPPPPPPTAAEEEAGSAKAPRDGESVAEYMDGRLATLYDKVRARVESLQREDLELYEKRDAASARLRTLRVSIESSGEVVADDATAIESKGLRTQYRSLHTLVEECAARAHRTP